MSKKPHTDYPKRLRCPQCKRKNWRFPSNASNVQVCWNCYLQNARSNGSRRGEKLYGIWCTMKTRCYNPNCSSFAYYGAQGVTVCASWRNNYPRFRTWAISHGYAPGLTLERRKNHGGYSPNNCRWTTRKEQSRHRRNTTPQTTVDAIKAMLAAGVAQCGIVQALGVSKYIVSKIFRGKAWA